eukprot:scaffold57126_cov55-Phaeocystis_antarctica.AAC.1
MRPHRPHWRFSSRCSVRHTLRWPIKKPHSRFTRGRDAQHYGSDGRLRARGGRRRKLFGRALRVCLPRLRHLAASATIRGLKSTTDRLAATGSRRSRGRAQPAAQRLPIVEVKADMGFVVDVQTRSGAW